MKDEMIMRGLHSHIKSTEPYILSPFSGKAAACLDDKGVLEDDGAEAGDVGGEGLAREVGPGVDVQDHLHVAGPKVEAVLRSREHGLVVVVHEQLVLGR